MDAWGDNTHPLLVSSTSEEIFQPRWEMAAGVERCPCSRANRMNKLNHTWPWPAIYGSNLSLSGTNQILKGFKMILTHPPTSLSFTQRMSLVWRASITPEAKYTESIFSPFAFQILLLHESLTMPSAIQRLPLRVLDRCLGKRCPYRFWTNVWTNLELGFNWDIPVPPIYFGTFLRTELELFIHPPHLHLCQCHNSITATSHSFETYSCKGLIVAYRLVCCFIPLPF